MTRPPGRRRSAGYYDSLNEIVASAPAFVFCLDAEGRYLYSNRRFPAAATQDPEGKLLEDVHAAGRAAELRALMERVRRSGRPRSAELDSADALGRPRNYLVTLGPFFSVGRLSGYVGVAVLLASPEGRPVDADSAKRAGRLTPKQRETLILVAEGLSSREIGRRLGVSERTVETHREQLMDRLEIRGVAALARFAIAAGLL
ncbi:MAG TPA: LuxR C-terminal-related transcriptional regulator [Elusimicrobiota bacterium]|nr:LuxR C-terminal-related transcriptional regulator [Elusimicrobiota bacterium]